jgi:DnaA initiator-associating protein
MTTGMKLDRPPFPVLALTSNKQKQLAALGQSGDILFVIADNQDHDELAPVMESAISRDMLIIALTGEGSDSISGLLGANDIELRAPSMNPARVLETQLFIIHGLCEQIENTIFPQEH